MILDTIYLATGPVVFNDDVRIIQPAGQTVSIQSASSPVFSITAGIEIMFRHLHILAGVPDQSALINDGSLYLEDVEITHAGSQYPGVYNSGFLSLKGNCILH